MDTAFLTQFATEFDRDLNLLNESGWDAETAKQLIVVLMRLIDHPQLSNWLDVSGRAKELVAVFNEFRQDPPEPERLECLLNSAHNLVALLRKGPLTGQIHTDLLPGQPDAWAFCFMGGVGAELAPLCQALANQGFGVTHDIFSENCESWWHSKNLVLLGRSDGFEGQKQSLNGLLCRYPSQNLALILVGLLDENECPGQFWAKKLGVDLVVNLPVDIARLMTELAGYAWMPHPAYKVLLLTAEPERQIKNMQAMRTAGMIVLSHSDPVQALDALPVFCPDVIVTDGTLVMCQDHEFVAFCRDPLDLSQLPIIHWTSFDNDDCTMQEGGLLASIKDKARRHRWQQESAKRWRAIQESHLRLCNTVDAHSIISVAAADGTIEEVNQKFCEISGYSREELIGRNHRMIKSGHHPPEFFAGMWRCISSGVIWQGEIQNRRKDGRPYWVQSTIAPIMDSSGKPKQYFSIRTDVTEQKQIQAEAKKQHRLMNLLRESLHQFNKTNNLAATLNTVLDGLLVLTESAFGFIAEANFGTNGAESLNVKAITDISWDDDSRHRYQQMLAASGAGFKKLDNTLYGAVVNTARPIISNNPQNDPRSGGVPQGHPRITAFLGMPIISKSGLLGVVALANKETGYDDTLLSFLSPVTETCANLIEAARAIERQQQTAADLSIFFEQAEKKRKLQTEQIAATRSGLRSELDSLFGDVERLLALAGVDGDLHGHIQKIADAKERTCQLLDRLAIGVTNGKRMDKQDIELADQNTYPKILVVEDNPANQAVIKMQLKVLGIEADMAASGTEAMAKWKQGGGELMLSDLHLPGMDGLELARSIRAAEQGTGKRLPIIAITASTCPEELTACLLAGMDDTLCKPIDLNDLRLKLQQWLPKQQPAPQPPLLLSDTKPPQTEIQNRQALDIDYLLGITGGLDYLQIRSLIDLFTSSSKTELALCKQHLMANNASSLASSMHKLKSSAQAVGAMRFADLARKLEVVAKEALWDEAAVLLRELDNALNDVEQATVKRGQVESQPNGSTLLDIPWRVLVVDDDAVVRRQISLLLTYLGVAEILVAETGMAGLKLMQKHSKTVNLLLCDLNMPEMDGIEFLRRMSEMGYQGGIILVSGVDGRLMQSAVELAGLHGLHLLGSLGKPLSLDALLNILGQPNQKQTVLAKKVIEPMVTAKDILSGLAHNQFDVFFQPKVDAFTLKPVGVEALARWHRRGKTIPADVFIVAAEHHNLIAQLSEVLLVKAFIGGKRLAEAGFPLTISVNLSAKCFSDVNLPDFIHACLQATDIKAENVIFEITETGLMDDLAKALDILTRLRLKGFKLSIDDFGTGYSSLEQLQRIPFSELKLDRTFVKGAADNVTARTILSASIDMASKLNLITVAEGVETQHELDIVRGFGCDLVQGWLIAKAMPMDDLIAWLQAYTTKH